MCVAEAADRDDARDADEAAREEDLDAAEIEATDREEARDTEETERDERPAEMEDACDELRADATD